MNPPSVIAVLVLFGAGTVGAQLSISNDPGMKGLTPPGTAAPNVAPGFGPAISPGTGLPMPGFSPGPAPNVAPVIPNAPGTGAPGLPGPATPGVPGAGAMPSLGVPAGPSAPAMPGLGSPGNPGAGAMPSLGTGLGGSLPGMAAPEAPAAARSPAATPAIGPATAAPAVAAGLPDSASAASPEATARVTAALQQMNDLLAAGKLQEALNAAVEALRHSEEGFGKESLVVVRRRMDIAMLLRLAGNTREAMDWAEKSVGLEQKVGDMKSMDYAVNVQRLGEIYLEVGQFLAAHRAFTQSYEILKSQLPENDPSLISAMHNLGAAAFEQGLPEAKELLTKALAARIAVSGADSLPVAASSGMLARCYMMEGGFATAQKLMQAALRIYRSQGKAQEAMVARTLDDLATCHARAGEHEQAEARLREQEAMIRDAVGEDSPRYTPTLSRRAELALARGDLEEAERFAMAHLDRVRKEYVPGSAVILNSYLTLASTYARTGSIGKAQSCYRDALGEVERTAGANSVLAAEIWKRLADFHIETTLDTAEAEQCLRRMLAIQTQALKMKGDSLAMTKLARICQDTGQLHAAEELLREVIAQETASATPNASVVEQAQGYLGEIDSEREATAQKRATLERHTRDLREAEERFRGDRSAESDVAAACNALADSHLIMGDPVEAEKHARRSLEISRRIGGPASDLHRDALRCLIYALQDQKKDKAAEDYALQWMTGEQARLEGMAALKTAGERLQWLGNQRFTELPGSLRMPRETALLLLRTKGLHFDVARVPHGESEAAGGAAVRGLLSSTLDDVNSTIPADAAVLDYFSFCCRSRGGEWVNRYGVVVLRRGEEPVLRLTKHTREEVDEMAGYFRAAMRQQGERTKKDAAIESLHKAFYQMVITPVEKELDGVKRLYICPDDQLQFVPFAALLDAQGRFLAERFEVSHLTSLRDLLRKPARAGPAEEKRIVMFADATPSLGAKPASARDATEKERELFADFLSERNAALAGPLPGAETELALITDRAGANGWKAGMLRGDEASETRARELAAPDCVHFATRGYLLNTAHENDAIKQNAKRHRDPRRCEDVGGVDARMDRSGVLLAGAQDSLGLWREGKTAAAESDGILTAGEAADLPLHGTQLVFLSACDTGMGAGTPASGAVALRSAFLHAGAREVITTLWPTPDEGAAGIVVEFYARYFASGDADAAFHETQRDWLMRVRETKGLWEAVRQAGGFMLVSSGAQE